MAGKSRYSDADKGRVYVALQINEGNIERTHRETGVPAQTIRDWRKQWERDGVPPEIVQAADDATDNFVEDAVRVRNKALRELERQVDGQEMKGRDLIVAVGVLDDKLTRAKGLPTSRSEQTVVAIDAAQVRAQLTGFVRGALEMAREREADIIEVEAIEEPA